MNMDKAVKMRGDLPYLEAEDPRNYSWVIAWDGSIRAFKIEKRWDASGGVFKKRYPKYALLSLNTAAAVLLLSALIAFFYGKIAISFSLFFAFLLLGLPFCSRSAFSDHLFKINKNYSKTDKYYFAYRLNELKNTPGAEKQYSNLLKDIASSPSPLLELFDCKGESYKEFRRVNGNKFRNHELKKAKVILKEQESYRAYIAAMGGAPRAKLSTVTAAAQIPPLAPKASRVLSDKSDKEAEEFNLVQRLKREDPRLAILGELLPNKLALSAKQQWDLEACIGELSNACSHMENAKNSSLFSPEVKDRLGQSFREIVNVVLPELYKMADSLAENSLLSLHVSEEFLKQKFSEGNGELKITKRN